MSGADAFAAVADRPDLFADRVHYERILACRDMADWCRAQDGAGMTAADAFELSPTTATWDKTCLVLQGGGGQSPNPRDA